VWSEHWLTLRYRNNGEVYGRKLGPLGLVLKGGVWYLVAQSGKSIRTYRVAQIVDAEVTDEPFARPKKFDLVAHWEKAARDYETGTFRERADVRLSPTGIARLDLLGPFVKSEAMKSAGKPDRQGWVRCALPVESGDYGLRELLRLGEEVEIVGPAALRAQMAATLAAMQRRHSGAGLRPRRLAAKRST
jgi:predicted DNA-binding transcriptional regulator YafY